MLRWNSRLIFVILLFGSSQTPVSGQILWDGGNGNWFGPWLGTLPGNPIPPENPTTNWSCEFCYPGVNGYVTSTVNIGNFYGSTIGPVSGTVMLTQSVSVAGLSLGNGAQGALQVLSGGNLSAGTLDVGISGSGTGSLLLSNGVVNSSVSTIGGSAGSSGAVSLTGTASRWNNSASLYVGDYGNGTLTIQSGGQAINAYAIVGYQSGSSGLATVTGSGSV
jgi:T5SS/PEP-CTERM-associated repeat protein